MNKSELIDNVEKAIAKDQQAIARLYDDTYNSMYLLAYNLCRNVDTAEDILQESYITAFTNLEKLRDKGRFVSWLKGIIINKWREDIRDDKHFGSLSPYGSAEESPNAEDQKSSVQAQMEQEEVNDELWRQVNVLPENQRICILLFYYHGMSVDEIASVLNIPTGSVKSRLHYGRARLKKKLSNLDLFSGAALSASAATAASGSNSDMLANILAALETAAKGSGVVIAAKAAGGGMLLKVSAWLLSAATVAGALSFLLNQPVVPDIELDSSGGAMTAEAGVPSMTMVTTLSSAPEKTETTTAAVPKTVSFDYKTVSGGICITKYTGDAEVVAVPPKVDGYKVVAVGDKAFQGCRVLKSVEIPSTVTYIGSNAFRECCNLSRVTLCDGRLNSIGDAAFAGCESLKSVKIPSSVRRVGIYAFAYCTSLKSVTIAEGTEIINYCAFYKCRQLGRVTLPGSVTVIGEKAFADTSENLTILVKQGTYSHDYALANSFKTELVE